MIRLITLLLALAAMPTAGSEPSVEARLIATIGTGRSVGLDLADIDVHARAEDTDYYGHLLARSALVVLDEDKGFHAWPLPRLLDRTLDQLTASTGLGMPADLGRGFRSEHLIALGAYALVMTGDTTVAVDVLAKQVDSRVPYKRAAALQMLRFIGGKAATEAIQLAGQGSGNLPENLLADYHYPFMTEIAERTHLIPPWNRDAAGLLGATIEPCSERGGLAVYWLGLLHGTPEDSDEIHQRLAELSDVPCYYTRFFARRALALHEPLDVDYWVEHYLEETDAWQRALLARVLFAHHPEAFLPVSLDLLDTEPSQYVQWELMHGNLRLRRGGEWRTYWDIWWPPTVQFLIDHRREGGSMPATHVDRLLSWLEDGAAPEHVWVRNHLLYGLAAEVSGEATTRFLAYIDALPDKTALWWIMHPLQDAAALPTLQSWAKLPAEDDQGENLRRVIERLSADR